MPARRPRPAPEFLRSPVKDRQVADLFGVLVEVQPPAAPAMGVVQDATEVWASTRQIVDRLADFLAFTWDVNEPSIGVVDHAHG